MIVTLAAELAKLEKLAKEQKEVLRPGDVTDLLTAIEYYVRVRFRRGKARTTIRAEYYDLMYFYEDHVLHNSLFTDTGMQPVPLSKVTADDILMHLHRLDKSNSRQPQFQQYKLGAIETSVDTSS
jgi:hypothetical protein